MSPTTQIHTFHTCGCLSTSTSTLTTSTFPSINPFTTTPSTSSSTPSSHPISATSPLPSPSPSPSPLFAFPIRTQLLPTLCPTHYAEEPEREMSALEELEEAWRVYGEAQAAKAALLNPPPPPPPTKKLSPAEAAEKLIGESPEEGMKDSMKDRSVVHEAMDGVSDEMAGEKENEQNERAGILVFEGKGASKLQTPAGQRERRQWKIGMMRPRPRKSAAKPGNEGKARREMLVSRPRINIEKEKEKNREMLARLQGFGWKGERPWERVFEVR